VYKGKERENSKKKNAARFDVLGRFLSESLKRYHGPVDERPFCCHEKGQKGSKRGEFETSGGQSQPPHGENPKESGAGRCLLSFREEKKESTKSRRGEKKKSPSARRDESPKLWGWVGVGDYPKGMFMAAKSLEAVIRGNGKDTKPRRAGKEPPPSLTTQRT